MERKPRPANFSSEAAATSSVSPPGINATAVGDTGKTIIGVAVMSVFVVGVNQLFWRPLQAYAERRFSVA